MDVMVSLLPGFLSGILYGEHLYLQTRIFPKRKLLLSFWVRFGATSVLFLAVAGVGGSSHLLSFFVGHLVGRFFHALVRYLKALR
jgi:hypothetical protein